MNTIELYKPGFIDKSINFPAAWNELHLQELHIISNAILGNFKEGSQAKGFLFLELFKYRCQKQKVGNFNHLLDIEDIVINGYPLIEFIYAGNSLTKQPYPILILQSHRTQTKNYKLYGPADDFNNLICAEFEDAEIFYNKFKESPNNNDLAHLAAILYRPAKQKYYYNDPKQGCYTNYNAEVLLPAFLQMKPWELYSIFLWYAGCREQLPLYFPHAFEGSRDNSADPHAMTNCIHAAAGPKNGTREQVRASLVKEIFYEMNLEAKKAKEIEAEQKRLARQH